MKKLLLIFVALTFNNIFSQNHFEFTELRGLEDNSGSTHLFYRTGTNKSITNSIYHFNVRENSDTLFLLAFYYSFPYDYYVGVSDYDFFNSDPQKFIFCGSGEWPDAIGYISFYNHIGGFSKFDAINNIELSRQDTNLIYADYSGYLIKSTDYGLTWNDDPTDLLPNISLISLSPINDKTIFGLDINYHLVKSIDGGINFKIIDTATWSHSDTKILYDKDTSILYAISKLNNKWYFLSSNDTGNYFNKIYESNSSLNATTDQSHSGWIFLCDGKIIYKSEDYGKTFSFFNEQSENIIGIYSKPNSDKIYIATEKMLIEIGDQGMHSLKILTSIIENVNQVNGFILFQNYPNPFNPTTKIKYSVPSVGISLMKFLQIKIQLKIYDILGNEVATLVNKEQPAGNYEVEFDGSKLSSGIYFYILKAGDLTFTRKMCLIK